MAKPPSPGQRAAAGGHRAPAKRQLALFSALLLTLGLHAAARLQALRGERSRAPYRGDSGDTSAAAAAAAAAALEPPEVEVGVPQRTYAVPQLSGELARRHARNGAIMLTLVNRHFQDLGLNWVHHLQALNVTNYLVGATDAETGQALASKGLHVFALYGESGDAAERHDLGWGSHEWRQMVNLKMDVARAFLRLNLTLCFCDVDSVWLADPFPYFERHPHADLLVSSDALSPSNPRGDEGLEQQGAAWQMNTGLFLVRPTRGQQVARFLSEWQRRVQADSQAWEQSVFNAAASQGSPPFEAQPDGSRLLWGANRTLLFGVLPVAQFASGHTFFVQRLHQVQRVPLMWVHCTFQFGGSAGKRHRLREAMLWVDPPRYYEEGRLISVDLRYPDNPAGFAVQGGSDGWEGPAMVDWHLKAARQQLRQLATAFRLALALNRTLILPQLFAWCDRYWAELDHCRIPGADNTGLPFVAPLDHFAEPAGLGADANAGADHGPAISFREHSFLHNPRTPTSLLESKVVVVPTTDVAAAQRARGREGHEELLIPTSSTDRELREALAPLWAAHLLHFASLDAALGRFESAQDEAALQRRLQHAMGYHCCGDKTSGAFHYYLLLQGDLD